jgi:hypothetical protein
MLLEFLKVNYKLTLYKFEKGTQLEMILQQGVNL